MVGWQGDQPSDFNGFCHSLSRILELSNSSQPFVQFRWHTEWIMSVTPESHQNLRPALVIQKPSSTRWVTYFLATTINVRGPSHETMQLTSDIHDRGRLHRQDRLCEQRLRDRESFYEATGSTSRTLCPVLLTLCMSQQCQSPQCDVLDRVSEPTCFDSCRSRPGPTLCPILNNVHRPSVVCWKIPLTDWTVVLFAYCASIFLRRINGKW